eukprot:Gregarina_sp_Poly_1__1747@NODE_1450_length_4124_cov_47_742913_g962_i0_p1_GENE_NODE_1450_length_4124_cov_47_742913_g962_i0NODE_1450_length_4124_cov_47_742913_g962_i0_p1_ORF_typecomplete_len473_score61_43DNA_pol_A_exo1/PF01612_20/9_8e02DNA_pol_A_exo1/PF01612_20/6_2e26_NODE_1450_length_4124_cov_47_742913_g962_i019823400
MVLLPSKKDCQKPGMGGRKREYKLPGAESLPKPELEQADVSIDIHNVLKRGQIDQLVGLWNEGNSKTRRRIRTHVRDAKQQQAFLNQLVVLGKRKQAIDLANNWKFPLKEIVDLDRQRILDKLNSLYKNPHHNLAQLKDLCETELEIEIFNEWAHTARGRRSVQHASQYKLTLQDLKSVYTFVESVADLTFCIDYILDAKVDKLGIDCEWNALHEHGVALMQIAFSTSGRNCGVLLLDMQTLHREDAHTTWRKILAVLENKRIIKFGFGFTNNDTLRLNQMCESNIKLESYIDLALLMQAKRLSHETVVCNEQVHMSLASAVQLILGASIDKTYQVSNWNRRPLALEQLEYASLDAVVMLLLGKTLLADLSLSKLSVLQIVHRFRALEIQLMDRKQRSKGCSLSRRAFEELRDEWSQKMDEGKQPLRNSSALPAGNMERRFLIRGDEVKLIRILRGLGIDCKAARKVWRAFL